MLEENAKRKNDSESENRENSKGKVAFFIRCKTFETYRFPFLCLMKGKF